MDKNKATFLDVLIECDQKTVVSNAAVRKFTIYVFRIYEDQTDDQTFHLGTVLFE